MSKTETPPNTDEKRRHPRINTSKDVSYILFDENENRLEQGVGRTLNLSQNGALLETDKPLYGAFIMLITIDLDGQKIQLKGRVANTRKSAAEGCYLTGIEFTGALEEQRSALVAFVKAYHYRKHAEAARNKPVS